MLPMLLASLLATPADAGVFNKKTMHADWAETTSSRELVMPRGWFELGLGIDSKSAGAVRGTFGIAEPYDDATFRYSRLNLSLRQGFTDRATLYLNLPIVNVHLRNGYGADIGTTALGDARTGIIYQPMIGKAHAFAIRGEIKSPSGMEWPANTTGGGAFTEGFLTGTGTTNFGLHVEGRYRLNDKVGIDGTAGYTYKFAGIVGYLNQAGGFGNGYLKPGNELSVGLSATAQVADPLSISLGAALSQRGSYFYGVSGPGVAKLATFWLGAEEEYEFSDGEVLTVETSPAGVFFDPLLHVALTPDDNWEFGLDARYSLIGADGRFFSHLGLEEFSPHPGLTLGVSGAIRW